MSGAVEETDAGRPPRGPGPAGSANLTRQGWPIRDEYLMVDAGKLTGGGAHSYGAGDARLGRSDALQWQDLIGASGSDGDPEPLELGDLGRCRFWRAAGTRV
jgi:hypothetical protein